MTKGSSRIVSRDKVSNPETSSQENRQPRFSRLSEIPKAKSSHSPSAGLHGWMPYYAGFSADFVTAVLKSVELDSSSLAFDPFAGCGTTNLVCKIANIPSIGLELNPAAFVVANAKLGWEVDVSNLKDTLDQLRPKRVRESARNISFENLQIPLNDATEYLLNAGHKITQLKNDLRFFLLGAAIETLRRVSNLSDKSNPTWPVRQLRRVSADQTYSIFSSVAAERVAELAQFKHHDKCPARVVFCDASAYEPDFKADVIITSPPYLNRLDYIMNFSLENSYLVSLSFPVKTTIDELRTKMIGTVKIDNSPHPNPEWGPTCLASLNAIKNHNSKAAQTYYLKTMTQYFERLFLCIRMISSTLHNDAPCFMVVRNSYFKDLEIPLALILEEMATGVGFREISSVREDWIRSHLGRTDPDQRRWMRDKSLVENIILMRR